MRTCIVSANCQGLPLVRQLLGYLPFSKYHRVEYYINFKKELIPLEKLQTCNILIYQKLDSSWNELSEEYLLSHVNPKAKTISMPNMLHLSLWPMSKGTGDLSNPYNEEYVDKLLERRLSLTEINYLVRKVDLANHYDLQALYDKSIERERQKDYLRCSELCDFIEENFSAKQLFTTINHPYGELLNLIARYVLMELDYRKIPSRLSENLTCDNDYYMPIHPSVAKFFNLSFAGEDTKYPIYGNRLTYYEYIAGYVMARQHDIPLAHYFTYISENKRNKS